MCSLQVLEGEKQAIQNELEKDIPQTTWKKFSILKQIADPKHPFHRSEILGHFCILSMLYSVYVVSCLCCILSMLYPVYVVSCLCVTFL